MTTSSPPALPPEILNRVPAFRDRADLTVTFLSGGITNQNYRIDVGQGDTQQSYVLRLGGAKTELLGINRANEAAANRAAAAIGVAPAVVDFIEPEGYLIAAFIRGREIPPEEMRAALTLRVVGAVLARVHALPPIPGAFSPFDVVREYDALARANGVHTFPDNYEWLRDRMQEMEEYTIRHPVAAVPCHNDLLNGNFLRDAAGQIRILDWEYAGMGDPFFDLGNFSAHHELTELQQHTLLDAYFQTRHHSPPPADALTRLKLMQCMSDFREAMWGVLQQGISQLDFDFRGYADQFFAKLTRRMADGG